MHWSLLLLLAVGLFPGVSCLGLELREKRQALQNTNKWDNNTLNFYFADDFPNIFEQMFIEAMEYIEQHTCVKFTKDDYQQEDYKVRIQYNKRKDKCMASFGQRNSNLYFGYNCGAWGVAVHELMHALGIAHAQARSDRDDYLVVDSDDYNDEIENTWNPVPFDYGSVMLYERNDNRYPKDPEYNYTMGNLRVAFYDMQLLNIVYNCSCPGKPLECQNGGYQNPSNCDSCLCTDGFKGKLCDEYDGIVLEAEEEWKSQQCLWARRRGIDRKTKADDTVFVITAPPGATIEAQITKLSGFFCQNTCDYNGVEIKYKEDRRIVSPLVCCDNDNLWNKTRSTTNNPLVIVKYGNNRGPKLEFRYRYVAGKGNTTIAAGASDKKVLKNKIDQK